MKKLKKFFGVFAVVLLLMSMSSNTTILKKDKDCFNEADIFANDFACHLDEEDIPVTHANWFQAWEVAYVMCMD